MARNRGKDAEYRGRSNLSHRRFLTRVHAAGLPVRSRMAKRTVCVAEPLIPAWLQEPDNDFVRCARRRRESGRAFEKLQERA